MGRLAWDSQVALLITFLGVTSVHVKCSQKKGVAVNPRSFLCDDFKVLNNIAWWYDWGANIDNIRKRSSCENVIDNADIHIPMVWGYGSYFSNYYIYDHAEYLLGFNEPNHHGQSNITPREAASYWKEVEKLANGRLIVSPAAAPCGTGCNGNTTKWFDEFFGNCTDCRIDFLATHAYFCSANKTMEFLEDLYKRYNKSIWLTEFSCPYANKPERELKYMKEVLPLLEAAPYVFRYAWFASRVNRSQETTFITSAVNLLQLNMSSLTMLGTFYNNFNWTSVETTTYNGTTFETTTSKETTIEIVTNASTSQMAYNTTTSSSNENTTKFTVLNTTIYSTTIFNFTRNNTYIVSKADRKISLADSILLLTTWSYIQVLMYN